jgi:hypothetical protein
LNQAYYQVKMQPLTSANTYGTNTDISDKVIATGVGSISRRLDAFNSSIGVFKFANTNISCSNKAGYFNDTGTFFTFKRDLAKVQILFFDKDGTEFTNFTGIVNEQGVSAGINNDTISFLVTSRESVLNQVQVVTADISDADTFSTAIKAILNKTSITSVMGYDVSKIAVGYNGAIDVSSKLHNLDTKTVLDLLLQASNSIFYIDSAGDMNVATRTAATASTSFYGAQDVYGRENIIQLFNYSGGYSRIYNSVIVNGTEAKDATSITNFGLRQLGAYTFDFITNGTTETTIAETIRNEFKDRKKECTIKVTTDRIKNLNVLEKVVLDLVASNYNSIDILSTQTWKIIGITEYPSNYTADISLREI